MESMEMTQPAAEIDHASSEPTEAERLFEQLMACEPGPSKQDLINLIDLKGLPNRSVFAAIVNHPDFDIYNGRAEIFFNSRYILDCWGLIPLNLLNDSFIAETLRSLPFDSRYDHIRMQIGQRLIELKTRLNLVMQYVPALKQAAWEKLSEQEDTGDTLAVAINHFEDEDKRQKTLWILKNRPALARYFVTSDDHAIGTLASTIALNPALSIDQQTLLFILQNEEDESRFTPDTVQKAAQRLLDRQYPSQERLLSDIVMSRHATHEQKCAAADRLLALDVVDTNLLRLITKFLPEKADAVEATIARKEQTEAEEEASKPLKDRLLEQLLALRH